MMNRRCGLVVERHRLACGRSVFDPRLRQTKVVKTGCDSVTYFNKLRAGVRTLSIRGFGGSYYSIYK